MLSPLSLSSRENLWLLRDIASSLTESSPNVSLFFSSSACGGQGGEGEREKSDLNYSDVMMTSLVIRDPPLALSILKRTWRAMPPTHTIIPTMLTGERESSSQ